MTLLITKQLNPEEIINAPYLFNKYPPLLVSSGSISPSEYTEYLVNVIQYSLNNDKKSSLLIEKGRMISGIALLKFRSWDSDFFKLPVGSIEYLSVDGRLKGKEANELARNLVINSVNLAKKTGIKALYISAYSKSWPLIQAVSSLGFNFICGEIEGISTKRDSPFLYRKNSLGKEYEFRKYKKSDYKQIMKISGEINDDVESKFSLTPFLREKEKRVYYLESIRNCCLGINADNVFVVSRKEVPVGFLCYRYDRRFEDALNKKLSFSVMGGISRAERGENIGTHFFNWAHKQVLRTSEVIVGKVYLHNLPMIRFILGRRFTHSFATLYTFCKKL
ncbi:MAG: hypothetical protein PHE18_03060 [Candidatus Omnitrophica bacterium]|nr:hypothetical protein [Candidatus Omnitrophota bacterium]MDD5552834.1 hypothetical protein [Candidatus Omnitrophota bacterium]